MSDLFVFLIFLSAAWLLICAVMGLKELIGIGGYLKRIADTLELINLGETPIRKKL